MKTTAYVLLPKGILDELDKVELSKSERNHSIRFIDYLMRRSFHLSKTIDDYVSVPSSYFEKVFNSRYYIWLKKLENAQIILTNHSYSTTIHICKSYTINTNLTLPSMFCTNLISNLETVSYTYQIQEKTKEEKKMHKMIYDDIYSLKIDKKALMDITDEYIETITIDKYKVDEEVDGRIAMKVSYGKGKRYFMQRAVALRKAKEDMKSLIQDGDEFYIMSISEFILRKKISALQAYYDAINKLYDKKIYGKRNDTNNRLDTNLTNMAKILVKDICEKNSLIQLDLCNSQFAILSHHLEDKLDTEDFKQFKEQSYNGTLYEHIQETLGLKTRQEAKKATFELMFSKENLKSDGKEKLKKLFPSVVEFVDDFKKEYGYNNFSIMLQKIESEIFIDGIWKEIKKNKLFCTPKHDCLIVRGEDKETVSKIISNYFKKIDFRGKIIQE
jgi:hypothetical protein